MDFGHKFSSNFLCCGHIYNTYNQGLTVIYVSDTIINNFDIWKEVVVKIDKLSIFPFSCFICLKKSLYMYINLIGPILIRVNLSDGDVSCF